MPDLASSQRVVTGERAFSTYQPPPPPPPPPPPDDPPPPDEEKPEDELDGGGGSDEAMDVDSELEKLDMRLPNWRESKSRPVYQPGL